MAAYLTNPARPIVSVTDAASLRSEPSPLLRTGTVAVFSDPTLFSVLARYDEADLSLDDGTTVWKPDDKDNSNPGRWLIFGGESAGPHTYVKRKADGSIDGLTADFSNPVVRVNFDIGANDPVPAVPCGLSVDRGAVAGVERDRATLLWTEALQAWSAVFSTTSDTVLSATHIPVIAGGFRAPSAGASGFVRLRADDKVTALVGGSTYDLAQITAGGVATLGGTATPSMSLLAAGNILATTTAGQIALRGPQTRIVDATGATELVLADTGTGLVKVTGDLSLFDGANLRAFFDVAPSAVLGLLGLFRQGDPTAASPAATVDIGMGTVIATADATPQTTTTVPIPANGSALMLVLVKAVQSDGSNGFCAIIGNCARRSGAAAPTLAQGAAGLTIASFENTFAVVKPTIQFVVSGNNVLVQPVGKAATNINWQEWHVVLTR